MVLTEYRRNNKGEIDHLACSTWWRGKVEPKSQDQNTWYQICISFFGKKLLRRSSLGTCFGVGIFFGMGLFLFFWIELFSTLISTFFLSLAFVVQSHSHIRRVHLTFTRNKETRKA